MIMLKMSTYYLCVGIFLCSLNALTVGNLEIMLCRWAIFLKSGGLVKRMRSKGEIMRYKMILAVFLCFVLMLAVLSVDAASLKRGSSGSKVEQLQQRLKNWGYYKGEVDGIYGSGTENAVKQFQRKNGLTADGVVGPATAKKIGITLSGGQASASKDVDLLARLIYGEARGEPYEGQVAVAAVVLNRVESSKFPNSIASVIYQPGAFDVVSDGQIYLTPDDTAYKAARDAMAGWVPTVGCIYYYNPRTATSSWIKNRPVIRSIGRHVFCF